MLHKHVEPLASFTLTSISTEHSPYLRSGKALGFLRRANKILSATKLPRGITKNVMSRRRAVTPHCESRS